MSQLFPHSLTPRGYRQLTVSTGAVGLTLPVSGKPIRMAVVMVEDEPLRYRDDGVDPTATVGMLVPANTRFELYGSSISNFKAIRSGATDAVLSVHYYGEQ